ncbi:Protein FAR1-RELATED SEQUENCE 5 [Linum perenne]
MEHLKFPTKKDAVLFYKMYVKFKGFSVRTQLAEPNVEKEKYYYIYILCNKADWSGNSEHNPKNKGKMNSITKKRNVREIKEGCNKAYIKMRTDKKLNLYSITEFIDDHKHDSVDEEERQCMRSNRETPVIYKVVADINDSCGVPVRNSYDSMRKTAGGMKQLGFLHTDLKNYIWEKRTRDMQGGDVTVIANHFCKKQNENDGFFFDKELDSDENIASIFWSDPTMRKDFKYFGDSISFDTTYRTNNTARPLGKKFIFCVHSFFIILCAQYYVLTYNCLYTTL